MEEKFEQNELVEVRDFDNQNWIPRVYVGTMPNCKWHWAMKEGQNKENFDGHPEQWNQTRKIEPETIEQPKKGTLEHLQAQVDFLTKRLIQVELRFEDLRNKRAE
jgi:hypothetical protein